MRRNKKKEKIDFKIFIKRHLKRKFSVKIKMGNCNTQRNEIFKLIDELRM